MGKYVIEFVARDMFFHLFSTCCHINLFYSHMNYPRLEVNNPDKRVFSWPIHYRIWPGVLYIIRSHGVELRWVMNTYRSEKHRNLFKVWRWLKGIRDLPNITCQKAFRAQFQYLIRRLLSRELTGVDMLVLLWILFRQVSDQLKNTDLTPSRLYKICRYDFLSDINSAPRLIMMT